MSYAVPGWYADPENPARWRWWDGSAWTDQVSRPSADRTPEGKIDKGFALHDGAGNSLGRVVAARSDRKLLSQDRTWWVSLARPIPQPLDALALGAAVTLNNIQLLVVNLADHRD